MPPTLDAPILPPSKRKENPQQTALPVISLLTRKDWEALSTSDFPAPTSEEKTENTLCPPEIREEIARIFLGGLEAVRNYTSNLARELKEGTVGDNISPTLLHKSQKKIFLIVQEAIHLGGEQNQEASPTQIILNHMGRKNLIRLMTPEQGFSLAISATRLKNLPAFKKIIFNFKSPKKEVNLLTSKTTGGERLGHLAAKIDFRDAIQYIACIHRSNLELTDEEGNSLTHSASKYGSFETINYLLTLSKKLFGKRNNKGQMPLDLESGPQICRSIALHVVALEQENATETLKKSLASCQTVQSSIPQRGALPSLLLTPPKLTMETLPIPPEDIHP